MRRKGRGGLCHAYGRDVISMYTRDAMKLHLKHFTLRHYIRYVKRQNKHVQHIHGFVFAGIITGLIAFVILYTDYGFWHETYIADDSQMAADPAYVSESPSESLGRFWMEAKEQFSHVGSSSANFLEGKETYTKEP